MTSELRQQLNAFREQWQGRANTLQPVGFTLLLPPLLVEPGLVGHGRPQCLLVTGPLLAGKLQLLDQFLGLAKLGNGAGNALIATAGLEQIFDLGIELLLEGPQVGDARAGGEEHVAQAATPFGDLLAPLDQRLVVDAEERREQVLIHPPQEPVELGWIERGHPVGAEPGDSWFA